MQHNAHHEERKESGYLTLHYHPRDRVVDYKLSGKIKIASLQLIIISDFTASSEDAASQYDFVMAFKIDDGQTSECKYMIHQLQSVGLFETFIYTSVQRDELIVLLKPNVRLFFSEQYIFDYLIIYRW